MAGTMASPFDCTGIETGPDGVRRYTGLPQNLVQVLRAAVDRAPDAPAVAELGGERLTYRQLWDRATRVAGGLRAAGVAPGNRVANRLPNGTDWVLVFWGTLLAGAVVVPVNTRFAPPEAWEERAQTVRADGVSAIAEAVLERWFTSAFREDHPETLEWAGRMLRETPPEGYAGCCEAIRDADLRDRLDAVGATTLVIAGADDPATPPEHGELIRDSIPGASFEVIPNAAHLANIEQPEAVTRAVLDHLSPTTARSTDR